MKRYAQLTLLLALAFSVSTGGVAQAGSYVVYACGGGPNNTWAPSITHGGMAIYPAPPGCGTALTSRHNGQPQGWTVPGGAASRWYFWAPSGAWIDAVAMNAEFQTLDHRWDSVLSNGSTILFGCHAQDQCTQFLNGDWMSVPGSNVLYTEVYCPVGPCPAYWQPDSNYSNVFADSYIFSAAVRVNDVTAPGVSNARGAAWTDQWISGTQPVTFDASDNTGISSVVTSIDTTRSAAASQGCDAYQMTCPNWPGATLDVDTRLAGDGAHRLVLGTVDRAGNYGETSRTINIDNTAPIAPTNISVGSGGPWRQSPHVSVIWSDPKQDYAPIAGATLEACPSGASSGCVSKSIDGRDVSEGDIDLPSPGQWDLRVWLRDAAGNQTRANASDPLRYGYDPDPPVGVAFLPLDPENPSRIFVQAQDRLAGIAGGEIEIRRDGTTDWRTLPTSVEGGGVSAALPDDQLADGRYLLRARVWDGAGNERTTTFRADGSDAVLTLPVRVKTRMLVGKAKRLRARSARGRRRFRTVYVRNPLVRHGRRARMSGRLLAPGGNPLVGGPVEVAARVDLPGAVFAPVATLTTSKSGRFSYLLPAGPSRIVQFHYGGAAKIRPQTKIVRLRVRAGATLRARPNRVVTGEYTTFRGRITTRPVPSTGKLVELQYFDRGHWRTFRSVRAAATTGRWRYSYRFTGTAGVRTYRFRAYVPRENSYPYAPGASHSVRVTVRGL